MGGMRPSHLPAPAAIPTPLSRQRRSLDPPWRGRRERPHAFSFSSALSSAAASSSSPPLASSSSASSTPSTAADRPRHARLPFRFETGVGLFAKRPPRPFPPPFLSPPSASFSDPLSTHDQSRHRRGVVNGELLRGLTNGDDAVYASDFFVCANDGVGAWAARPRGHAGLWSRLILHFWASAIEEEQAKLLASEGPREPDAVATLQQAYQRTLDATLRHDWQGTTTACGAQLHYKASDSPQGEPSPLLYVTNLGDCQVMVLRPRRQGIIYKTKEQWHWFDCPRQLGTNSPDIPSSNAVTDAVDLEVGDVVLAMSDGVIDNLWEHEIVESVSKSLAEWESGKGNRSQVDRTGGRNGGMKAAAQDLVAAARAIAMDPFAESPFMERAIEEGLASEGGKPDDISVVAALCVKNDDHDRP